MVSFDSHYDGLLLKAGFALTRTLTLADLPPKEVRRTTMKLTLAEVTDKAVEIMVSHCELAEMDAGFDGGEFSGPAHGRMGEKEITDLAEANGFTLEDVYGEISDRSNLAELDSSWDSKWWEGCPEHGKNSTPSGSCHECAMLMPNPSAE